MKIKNLKLKINSLLVFLFILLLPTQLGKHFFLPFSYLSGVRIDYLAPTIYLTNIIAFLLIVLNCKIVVNFFKNKKILIILGLLLINIVFSLSPFISLYQYIKILEFLAVLAVFSVRARRNPHLQKLIFFAFFLGGLFELLLVMLQMVNKHSIQGIFYWFGERYITLSMPGVAKAVLQGTEFLRPYGTFSHPNSMGGFYLLVYFLTLLYFNHLTIKPFNHLFKQILLLVYTLLVFFSFSKIAILTLVFLSSIFYLRSSAGNCKLCLIAKITTLISIALIFLFAQTDPLSLEKRLTLIKNSLQIIANNPIFGVGLGSYLVAQNQFPIKYSYFFLQPVHNIFLLLLTEIGMFISLIIALLIVNWLKPNLKKLLITNYLLLITVLITGSFDHYWLTLQQNFLLLAVILGVIFSPHYKEDRQSEY